MVAMLSAKMDRLTDVVAATATKPTVTVYDSYQSDKIANTSRYEMATAYANKLITVEV